jgi:hypothetical protein
MADLDEAVRYQQQTDPMMGLPPEQSARYLSGLAAKYMSQVTPPMPMPQHYEPPLPPEPPPEISPEQQRYQQYAGMPDHTMTKAGVPLGVLRQLVIDNESKNFGTYDALAWHPNYKGDARERPTLEHGFPDWPGSRATGRLSHGAGAYSFEPSLWNELAPSMGIKDFSKESQDAVFNAAVDRYGVTPWRWNKNLFNAVTQARRDYSPTRSASN